jgi:hypothetical protein
LHEDAGAVPSVGVGAGGPAMLEVLERAQGAVDRLVRADSVEPCDKRDATRVVLVRGVVEALCPRPICG